MLIKINGHVSVLETAAGVQYGPMARYCTESNACGALHAVLDGAEQPFARDLREAFVGDGTDRLATLLDEQRVDPRYRYLFAALISARLQAQRALRDVEEHREVTPTVYLIVPCVTLNRPGPDTEIVCGYYRLDYRAADARAEYVGLGDEPRDYRVASPRPPLCVTCA
jgi:hypothetical protein